MHKRKKGLASFTLRRSGLASLKLRRSGQVLIESMIAIGALTVGLLGISTLLSNSLGLNRVVSEQYKGTYLAAEGIEIAKSILDRNTLLILSGAPIPWNLGFANGCYEASYDSVVLVSGPCDMASARFLKFDAVANLYQYTSGADTPFKRIVRIQTLVGRDDEIIVNSAVSWITRGGGSFSVDLEDHFFKWRLP